MHPAQTATAFLDLVERSGLLPADRLAPYAEADPPGDPARPAAERLARQLVRDRLITQWQAGQLLRGKARGYFLGDKYKVLEPIGAGGMGKVFLCEHLILHKLVAVKLLGTGAAKTAPPAGAVERFFREARAVAALDDKNILRVYDMDWAAGVPFMVMEYVDGADLHRLVSGAGPLSVAQACDYIRQAALGLQHAHEIGLVHRDVKPGNILVDRAGVVKILDLGLARFQLDTARNQGVTERFDGQAILGTADFISPEQTEDSSKVDIRSDIYSLGGTLYFLLTGKLLWEEGSFAQKLMWHQSRTPPSVRDTWPDIPDGVDAVVGKMLAKNPADRFQTPGEVAEVLELWSVPRPGPPASMVMPKVNPGAYLLGLSPVPPPASGRTNTPRPVTPAPRPHTPRPTPAPPPSTPNVSDLATQRLRSPSSVPPPAAAGTPPVAPAPAAAPVKSSRWRELRLVAAGGMLAAVFGAVFLAVRPKPESTAPPEGPPAVGGKPAALPAVVPVSKTLAAGGSSLAGPLMAHWTGEYERRGAVRIAYEPVGSGKGVEGVLDGRFAFGCTDVPLSDEQVAKARAGGREVAHLPLALAAVVPVYNVPGVEQQLRFTGPVLADLFLGKITRWDDEALRVSNPGAKLPALPVTVVHREDPSGTTAIWTDYLGKVSPGWKDGPGTGTTVRWPAGVGAKLTDGVAEAVRRTPGAIGYVEVSAAVANHQPVGLVRNRDGKYPPPTPSSVTAAATATLKEIPDDLRFRLTDAPGADSWPVAGAVWAVVAVPATGGIDPDVLAFLEWATHEGQAATADLRYAPLPPALVVRLDATFYRLKRR